jgi:exopolysaccharide biosynthesis predicted pyruvyltransferase EpsI
MEINILEFLKQYENKEIVYIPNPGNAGDSLIVYGTFLTFNKLKIKYKIGDKNKKYKNKLLFYAGGGNLIGVYKDCKNFLLKNKDENDIVILPHTVKDEDNLIKNFNNRIKIITREKKSYEYVKKIIKYKNNVFLSKDMAFYIDGIDKYKKKGKGICNCIRIDVEKTNKKIPKKNNDISITLKKNLKWKNANVDDFETVKKISMDVFNYLSKYEVINTNRLHISIAGALLNKKVNLYKNNYWKNEEMYKYSLKDKYPFVIFHEN